MNFGLKKIADALREAAKILDDCGIADARRDARLLLGAVLNRDAAFLIAHDDSTLTDDETATFSSFVKRRANREPLQYILGKQEFFGLDFEVNQNVLIPRPETELLVETALEILRKSKNQSFCDVGTGSGCIPIAILKTLENSNAVALDISPAALKVAQRNAAKHNVSDRIKFHKSDVFAVFNSQKLSIINYQLSIIISNPPYIPLPDLPTLQREVGEHEPHTALFGGADGLRIIEKLLNDAPAFLVADGFLAFEFGFGQSAAIENLIDARIWRLIEIRRDLQNIPRVVLLQKSC